jgi:hypothetical protein
MNKELLPPCRYCKYMERREQIKCDENCNSLNEFNDYVRTTIAARDKWWITQMETNFMAAIGCRLFPDNCDSCSIIERCTALSWQRFKREVGQ